MDSPDINVIFQHASKEVEETEHWLGVPREALRHKIATETLKLIESHNRLDVAATKWYRRFQSSEHAIATAVVALKRCAFYTDGVPSGEVAREALLQVNQDNLGLSDDVEFKNQGAIIAAQKLQKIADHGRESGIFGGPEMESAAQAILRLRDLIEKNENRWEVAKGAIRIGESKDRRIKMLECENEHFRDTLEAIASNTVDHPHLKARNTLANWPDENE